MIRNVVFRSSSLISILAFALLTAFPAQAAASRRSQGADSPYDLIDAVNALRASYGLPAFTTNATLMSVAQSHAEYMAATGIVSHTGAGGSSVTDRILAAGYPLAGDLSAGGFRSENITSGTEGRTVQDAVNQWTGDAPHLNTMISPNLTEIGAGVAVANGRVYFVIDCARPTTSGLPQSSSATSGEGSAVSGGEAPIPVVVVSTPSESGAVLHEVLPGQTLWQIAIAYNVKINEIRALNNLTGDAIYPGDTMLIKMETPPATEIPASTPTLTPTVTPMVAATDTATPTAQVPVPTSPPSADVSSDNATMMSIVIGLVAVAVLAGGFFAWRGGAQADA
jgi:uncharacterized protein YkwD